MRFKHFEGKTLSAARAQVRLNLGEDALITATHDLGEAGYRIVCALEPASKNSQPPPQTTLPPRQMSDLSRALSWHQFPFETVEEILDELSQQRRRTSNEEALASALKNIFSFEAIEVLWPRSRAMLFFGPPGAGKTATCVKLAWLARLAGYSANLISTDTMRTGGAEQLEMYAEKIGCRFFHSRSAQRFERLLRTIDKNSLLFIDAPGINPYAKEEISHLETLTALDGIVSILVLPTWIDIQAGIDLVSAFRVSSCRHIILTGEDIDRRLGRAVAIARAAALKLSYISPRPQIAQGLDTLDENTLASRCLEDIPPSYIAKMRATAYGLPNSQSQDVVATTSEVSAKNARTARGKDKDNGKSGKAKSSEPVIARIQRSSSRHPYRIAIASGKGGVGKTALAIGLAYSLSSLGKRVLLFDADLGLANIDIQLGLHSEHDLTQAIRGSCRLQDCVARAPLGGFDAIVGKSGTSSLAELTPHTLKKLLEDLEETSMRYDTLLLDLGAGIDRTVRVLSYFADEILVVITDEPTSLTDAYAFIKITLRRKPDARISVVVNMVDSERRGEQAYDSLRRTCHNFLSYELRLAGTVRRDSQVVSAIRKREPLMSYDPTSAAAADMSRLALAFSNLRTSSKHPTAVSKDG